MGLNVPSGTKLWGLNLAEPYGVSLTRMFQTWPWGSFILPAEQSVLATAGNTLRVIFDPAGYHAGAYTQSQLFSQIDQLAAQCLSDGVYLYPTLWGSFWRQGLDTPTLTAWCAMLAAKLNQHATIIPLIDVVNEYNLLGEAFAADALSMVAAVRGVTDLPLTLSDSTTPSAAPAWAPSAELQAVASGIDVIDLHVYVPAQLGCLAQVLSYGKDVIFGEVGCPDSQGAAAQASLVAQAAAVSGCRGVIGWCYADYDTAPDNRFGFFTASGAPKFSLLSPLVRGRVPPAQFVSPVVTQDAVLTVNAAGPGNYGDWFGASFTDPAGGGQYLLRVYYHTDGNTYAHGYRIGGSFSTLINQPVPNMQAGRSYAYRFRARAGQLSIYLSVDGGAESLLAGPAQDPAPLPPCAIAQWTNATGNVVAGFTASGGV